MTLVTRAQIFRRQILINLPTMGIRLQRYYVQRVCSPTRSAIMAGRYPYHLGLASDVIHPGRPYGLLLNQTTLANELKKGGYATHIVGKWHLQGGDTPLYLVQLSSSTVKIPVKSQTKKSGQVKGQIVIIKVQ